MPDPVIQQTEGTKKVANSKVVAPTMKNWVYQFDHLVRRETYIFRKDIFYFPFQRHYPIRIGIHVEAPTSEVFLYLP